MQAIRIAHISGGEKMYTSFSLDTFSEIKAEKDYVYLYLYKLNIYKHGNI